ncbi:MAG: hypothetical protein FJX72_12155 [Armatimonadetes bacterium]|nr:hypothetical protein [Armatimonadota bacterium]
MNRIARIVVAGLAAAGQAVVVAAQTSQDNCPSCGGDPYQNADCCKCEFCMGNYGKCARCVPDGPVTNHCKWVGNTCCHYVVERYKYQRKSGQGDTCPCEGYDGACNETLTSDVTEAYLYSGMKCYSISTGGGPSDEYQQMTRDPWRCLESAPAPPPGG